MELDETRWRADNLCKYYYLNQNNNYRNEIRNLKIKQMNYNRLDSYMINS